MIRGIGFQDTDFISLKDDTEIVKENVRRVLTTIPGENVGNIFFGSRVREYLFEFSKVLLEDIEQEIISSINRWEPRVVILYINIKEDIGLVKVLIGLALKSTLEEFSVQDQIQIF